MKNWTIDKALDSINGLVRQIDNVSKGGRNSEIHFRWLANTLRILEEIFGRRSRYYATLSKFTWCESGNMLINSEDYEGEIAYKHDQAFYMQMEKAKGLLLAATDHLRESRIEDVYEGENTAPEATELIQIINLGENKLRKLIRTTPKNEKEVQEKYEDLLIANNINYSREFPHIEYSSKKYIPDFSIEKIDLAIEIKLCRKDEKLFISQINDDILAYKTKFKNIIFVIYDLGQIRDVENFKGSFEKHQDIIIQIIKE